MDVGDGIEGMQMEQYTVLGRHPDRPPRRPQPPKQEAGVGGAAVGSSAVGTRAGQGQSEKDSGEGAMSVALGGVPVHHFLSVQATKGQILLQVGQGEGRERAGATVGQ